MKREILAKKLREIQKESGLWEPPVRVVTESGIFEGDYEELRATQLILRNMSNSNPRFQGIIDIYKIKSVNFF